METKEKRKLSQHAKGLATLFVAVMLLLCSMPMTAFAESGKTEITGKIYLIRIATMNSMRVANLKKQATVIPTGHFTSVAV